MAENLTIRDSIGHAIRRPEDRLPTELLCEPAVAFSSHRSVRRTADDATAKAPR